MSKRKTDIIEQAAAVIADTARTISLISSKLYEYAEELDGKYDGADGTSGAVSTEKELE